MITQTTARDRWRTPRWFFDELHNIFNFSMDLAADETNALLPDYFSEDRSALTHDWPRGRFSFLNPPFSMSAQMAARAGEQMRRGAGSVMLQPAHMYQAQWHDSIIGVATCIYFGRQRLQYEPPGKDIAVSSPHFSTAMVVFDHRRPHGLTTVSSYRLDARKQKVIWP